MSEREFAEYLIELLSNDDVHAERFFDRGVLTLDEGLVVDIGEHKFYLTIQQTR